MNRPKCRKFRGLTIMELIVAAAILILLSATLLPVYASVRQKMRTDSAVGGLRKMGLAIELYRANEGGANVFASYRSFYTLGLPTFGLEYPTPPLERNRGLDIYGFRDKDWLSPCSSDPPDWVICNSAGLPGTCGLIRYAAGWYFPRLIEEASGNRLMYHDYLVKYQENSVLAIDPECNPAGTNFTAPLVMKRALALLVSGNVKVTYKAGIAAYLQWYSDPPN